MSQGHLRAFFEEEDLDDAVTLVSSSSEGVDSSGSHNINPLYLGAFASKPEIRKDYPSTERKEGSGLKALFENPDSTLPKQLGTGLNKSDVRSKCKPRRLKHRKKLRDVEIFANALEVIERPEGLQYYPALTMQQNQMLSNKIKSLREVNEALKATIRLKDDDNKSLKQKLEQCQRENGKLQTEVETLNGNNSSKPCPMSEFSKSQIEDQNDKDQDKNSIEDDQQSSPLGLLARGPKLSITIAEVSIEAGPHKSVLKSDILKGLHGFTSDRNPSPPKQSVDPSVSPQLQAADPNHGCPTDVLQYTEKGLEGSDGKYREPAQECKDMKRVSTDGLQHDNSVSRALYSIIEKTI